MRSQSCSSAIDTPCCFFRSTTARLVRAFMLEWRASEVHRRQHVPHPGQFLLDRPQLQMLPFPRDAYAATVIAIDITGHIGREVLTAVAHDVLPHSMESIGEPFVKAQPCREKAPDDFET